MTPQTAALMASYNRWMNERLYEAAAKLPETEVTRDRDAFFGSILQTLNHIAVADTIWLRRFAAASPGSWLNEALLPFQQPTSLRQEIGRTLAELRSYRESLDKLIIDWAAGLTAEQLSQTLSYGQQQTRHFGSLVTHFFNHQTHHRGQATTLLFQAGVDVGVTDLVAVIPNEA